MTPPAIPMMIDAIGVTKPAAGVMQTRPATAPEAAPRSVGLPDRIHSAAIQPRVAAAAAVLVLRKAVAASSPDETALPALNPNQPTQSSEAPIAEKARLCGGIGWLG